MGTLHEDQSTPLNVSRSLLLRMRNVSDKSCRENQNTHFKFNNIFSKIVPCIVRSRTKATGFFLMAKPGKYCTAGQATDHNMAHAHCILDT